MSTMSSLSSHFGSSVEYNLTSLIFRSFAFGTTMENKNPSVHFVFGSKKSKKLKCEKRWADGIGGGGE